MKFDDIWFQKFWNYVVERQAIYHRRHVLREAPPWTDDLILQKYRFTDVYREHDRGTIYVLENLLPKYKEAWDNELWLFNCIVYRKFNLPRTHKRLAEALGDGVWITDWNVNEAVKVLKNIQKEGLTFRSVAYNTAAQGWSHGERCAKIDVAWLQRYNFTVRLTQVNSLEEAHGIIKEVPGFGNFMAMEVTQDLNYAQEPDRMLNFSEDEWAYVGPGGVRGLKLLLEGVEHDPLLVLRELWEKQGEGIKSAGNQWYGHKSISLNNMESCLCEFSKWEFYGRVNRGKRLFDAQKAYESDRTGQV
jgi:hypothetical protein